MRTLLTQSNVTVANENINIDHYPIAQDEIDSLNELPLVHVHFELLPE